MRAVERWAGRLASTQIRRGDVAGRRREAADPHDSRHCGLPAARGALPRCRLTVALRSRHVLTAPSPAECPLLTAAPTRAAGTRTHPVWQDAASGSEW